MGINGYTKKHGFFDEYEALKKQERAKLREPAAHPALADEEKQD